MPKVFDDRLSALANLNFGIGLLVCATYLVAAMAQLLVGWWMDRKSVKSVFVVVALMQVRCSRPPARSRATPCSRSRWR